MPPPVKRQKREIAGSGSLHDDGTRPSGPAGGVAKAAANKQQKKLIADVTMMKDEWCGLSKQAQSRHIRNEVLAKIRQMIPGPRKISENGLMLQAASTIKELEMEIHSLSNYLVRSQKSESSEESKDNISEEQSLPAIVPAVEETDGAEALRAVLPLPTKAKGKRLMESAWEYWAELQQEKRQLEACKEAQDDRAK